jgi:hypothetical protein
MTAGPASTVIRGAWVFDGQRLREAGSVLLAGGTIPAMARLFIAAGGDGLAHVLSDRDLTPAFLAGLRRRPAFVAATLRATAVLSSAHARQIEADQSELAAHPRLGPFLDPPTRAVLTRPGLLADAHAAAAACFTSAGSLTCHALTVSG